MNQSSTFNFSTGVTGLDKLKEVGDVLKRIVDTGSKLSANPVQLGLRTIRDTRNAYLRKNVRGLPPNDAQLEYLQRLDREEARLVHVKKRINDPHAKRRRTNLESYLAQLQDPESLASLSPRKRASFFKRLQKDLADQGGYYAGLVNTIQPWAKGFGNKGEGFSKMPPFIQELLGHNNLKNISGQYFVSSSLRSQSQKADASFKAFNKSLVETGENVAQAGDKISRGMRRGADWTNNLGSIARGVMQTTLREYLVGTKAFFQHALTPTLTYEEKRVGLEKVMPQGVTLEKAESGKALTFDFSGTSVGHLSQEEAVSQGLTSKDLDPAIRRIARDTGKTRSQVLEAVTQGIQGGAIQPFGGGFHQADIESYRTAAYQFGALAAQVAVAFDMTDFSAGQAIAQIKPFLSVPTPEDPHGMDSMRSALDIINHLSNVTRNTPAHLLGLTNRWASVGQLLNFETPEILGLTAFLGARATQRYQAGTALKTLMLNLWSPGKMNKEFGNVLGGEVAGGKTPLWQVLGYSTPDEARGLANQDAFGSFLDIMERARNAAGYDPETGEIKDNVLLIDIAKALGGDWHGKHLAAVIKDTEALKALVEVAGSDPSKIKTVLDEFLSKLEALPHALQRLQATFKDLSVVILTTLTPALTFLANFASNLIGFGTTVLEQTGIGSNIVASSLAVGGGGLLLTSAGLAAAAVVEFLRDVWGRMLGPVFDWEHEDWGEGGKYSSSKFMTSGLMLGLIGLNISGILKLGFLIITAVSLLSLLPDAFFGIFTDFLGKVPSTFKEAGDLISVSFSSDSLVGQLFKDLGTWPSSYETGAVGYLSKIALTLGLILGVVAAIRLMYFRAFAGGPFAKAASILGVAAGAGILLPPEIIGLTSLVSDRGLLAGATIATAAHFITKPLTREYGRLTGYVPTKSVGSNPLFAIMANVGLGQMEEWGLGGTGLDILSLALGGYMAITGGPAGVIYGLITAIGPLTKIFNELGFVLEGVVRAALALNDSGAITATLGILGIGGIASFISSLGLGLFLPDGKANLAGRIASNPAAAIALNLGLGAASALGVPEIVTDIMAVIAGGLIAFFGGPIGWAVGLATAFEPLVRIIGLVSTAFTRFLEKLGWVPTPTPDSPMQRAGKYDIQIPALTSNLQPGDLTFNSSPGGSGLTVHHDVQITPGDINKVYADLQHSTQSALDQTLGYKDPILAGLTRGAFGIGEIFADVARLPRVLGVVQ